MKKIFPVLLFAVALLPACCVSNFKHSHDRLTLPEQLERKTVAMVHWVDGNSKEVSPDDLGAMLTPYCSGVWITKNTFITAEHCVAHLGKPANQDILEGLIPPDIMSELGLQKWDPSNQPVLYSNFGDISDGATAKSRNTHPGIVLAIDADDDLALVRATTDELNPTVAYHAIASLANEATVGEEVHVVGHTMGLWWTYSHGVVAQLRSNARQPSGSKTDVIQVSAPVWFGNSGGGSFNDRGELLGIASWIVKAPEVGFFIRFNVIERFLEYHRTVI